MREKPFLCPSNFSLKQSAIICQDRLGTHTWKSGRQRKCAVFAGGDISYANGVDETWHKYLLMIERMAASIPWMIGYGNHELVPHDSGNESGENPDKTIKWNTPPVKTLTVN